MEELFKALLSSPEGISAVVSQYKPLIYAVCKEFWGMYKDLVNNEEYYTVSAKSKRNEFDALIDVGFTETQALALMINDAKKFKEYASKTSGVNIKLNS